MTPNNLRDEELLNFWLQEAEAHFSGWDFSHLSDRFVSSPLSWSYTSAVWPKLRQVERLLDMDTGGGELLARFQPLPKQTYATEAYPPNLPIARERLELLGANVVAVEEDDGATLPFDDDYFELIINRHGAFVPGELYRVLQPGGAFIAQQVGDQNVRDLLRLLGAPMPDDVPWNLAVAVQGLRVAGFQIVTQKEDIGPARIYDVGAIVYFLKAIPWTLPDFSVEAYFEPLKAIQALIERDGYVEVREHRFFIVCERPVVT